MVADGKSNVEEVAEFQQDNQFTIDPSKEVDEEDSNTGVKVEEEKDSSNDGEANLTDTSNVGEANHPCQFGGEKDVTFTLQCYSPYIDHRAALLPLYEEWCVSEEARKYFRCILEGDGVLFNRKFFQDLAAPGGHVGSNHVDAYCHLLRKRSQLYNHILHGSFMVMDTSFVVCKVTLLFIMQGETVVLLNLIVGFTFDRKHLEGGMSSTQMNLSLNLLRFTALLNQFHNHAMALINYLILMIRSIINILFITPQETEFPNKLFW